MIDFTQTGLGTSKAKRSLSQALNLPLTLKTQQDKTRFKEGHYVAGQMEHPQMVR